MNKKIFLALDNLSEKEILELVDELKEEVMFKLNDSFTNYGPEIIEKIHEKGGEIFLDLKFYDIPNTIANYSVAACKHGVFMFNIHALGGLQMMKAAREAVDKYCEDNKIRKPLIIGVTIITSMNEETMKDELMINSKVEDMVKHLSLLCKKAGLDGVVCSPKEIRLVKESCGKDFLTVTPGIRPLWSEKNDQSRITTPKDAVNAGGDYLVIGRPIIHAEKFGMTKSQAAKRIIDEMN